MTNVKTIEDKPDSVHHSRLNLLSTLPLSAMVMASFTHIQKDVPFTQNNSVAFPQQFSMFFSGMVTPHIGTFIQATYDGQSFGIDNCDIRLTNQGYLGTKSIIYGLTLNNNPAVQDVWNTSPAWRFPSATSNAAITPTKATIIEQLGMQVAGLGAYTLINNLLFLELSGYRSAQQGAANPADSSSTMAIKGVAPYWRVALEHGWGTNYFEVGTFGIASNHFIRGISGMEEQFTDLGFDIQYEHTFPVGSFTLHTSLINETEKRDTSDTQHLNLTFNSFKIDGNMYFKNGLGATVGYFNTFGTEDLAVGSLNNKPNSDGYIFQVEFLPWYNTKFLVQYVMYNRFNGNMRNYDGAGRDAMNNNAFYVLAWLTF
jgi:hypothetical protein